MNLSQEQKKFIKKNYNKLSPSAISNELKIQEHEIEKYIKKKYGELKIAKSEKELPKENNNLINIFKSKWYVFLSLFLLVAISYANSIGNAFVSDDIAGIANNPDIGNLSLLLKNPRNLVNGIPYLLIFKTSGLNPAAFRIYNIVLHLFSVFLIYILFLQLSRKSITSFVGAAMFASHPILTEGVTWISGRPYTQYTFLLLLSLYSYFTSKNNLKKYFFSIIFFIFAVLSSEKAIIFPLIIFVYELSFDNLQKNWKKVSGFFILLLIGGVYFASQVASRAASVFKQSAGSAGTFLNPLEQIPIAVTSYLELIFAPFGLTLYHSEMMFSRTNYLIRLGIFIAFITMIVIAFKKNKKIFFFLCIFLISLFPTMTPFGISWIVAERYIYFGSLGIFFVAAFFIDKIYEKENLQGAVEVFVFAILCFLIYLTNIRNLEWKNEDTLWPATVKTSPSSQNSHNNMGDVYARRGDFKNAELEFKKAIQINPLYSEAWHNLGLVYQQSENVEKAIQAYTQAIKINPQLWQSHENLAVIYFNTGKFKEAEKSLLTLLKINPEKINYYINLAFVENKIGNIEMAKKYLNSALSIDPNNKDALEGLKKIQEKSNK